MSESRAKKLVGFKRATWGFRVVESVRDGLTVFAIRKVHFDLDGLPESTSDLPPIEAGDADDLLAVINEIAMALSKPSILEAEIKPLPGLGAVLNG